MRDLVRTIGAVAVLLLLGASTPALAAVAVDGSSPPRVTGAPAVDAVTASFTAPANALLVACIHFNGDGLDTPQTYTVSDSGSLTWAKQVERTWTETPDGGQSAIFTAPQVTSASRTVTLAQTGGTDRRKSLKVYVLTGADIGGTPVDTVGAANEGGDTTNDLTTTSVTPGATGMLVVADTDWSASGTETSSDLTLDTADYPTEISVASGYKACTSGVGVTANLNAGGAGLVQHKWTQIVVRQALGGAPTRTLLGIGKEVVQRLPRPPRFGV